MLKIDASELWCWRRLLRVPWTARRSNQSILKDISPGISLEGMMVKLKPLLGHLTWRVDSLEKTDARRDWRQEEKGMTEDEMAGWHHWLDGREFEWTPGVGDGQEGLACCDSWDCKESDMTEWLNWTELLGRKVMTNLYSILKSRDITLPTKVRLVKAMVFPVVMYGCGSWTIKKAEHQRIQVFELWCWKRLLRVPGLQGDPTSPS